MSLSRRVLIGFAASAVLFPRSADANTHFTPNLVRFFLGKTNGRGRFVSKLAGVDRGFEISAHGRMDGADLILTEKVEYDDGVTDTVVWRFTKSGSGYVGRRTGVETIVPIRIKDDAVHLDYVAAVPSANGDMLRLRFEDKLVQIDDRTVINTAMVSYLGLRVGTVEVTFRRRHRP